MGFQLTNGDLFETTAADEGIVWLQSGVTINLEFVAPANAAGADKRSVVSAQPAAVAVTETGRTKNKLLFTLSAKTANVVSISGLDANGAQLDRLVVVAGDFKNHPGMSIDLLADVCRGSDPVKTLGIQRMLFNVRTNPFDQNNTENTHKFGALACGKVVKASALGVFGTINPIDYEHPYHERLSRVVKDRADVRYRPETIAKVQRTIKTILSSGTPVRVGALDSPINMALHDGSLYAYDTGGHTTLIVGCNDAATKFLYIDPWIGGSKMKYGGAIQELTDECVYLGMFISTYYATRAIGGSKSSQPNVLRQDWATEGTFNTGSGSYLEVVSGPKL